MTVTAEYIRLTQHMDDFFVLMGRDTLIFGALCYGAAGSIAGGWFLRNFVPDGVPWAHLDIAGPAFREKANGRAAAGGTGGAGQRHGKV